MEALSIIYKTLEQTWDVSIDEFPEFFVNFQLRAIKGKLNVAGDSGITKINGRIISTDYHSITEAQVIAARTARINDRVKQNSQALYRCLESSTTGSIKTTIFMQIGNPSDHEDRISLFKKITQFMAMSSVQLSNLSLSQILSLDPANTTSTFPLSTQD